MLKIVREHIALLWSGKIVERRRASTFARTIYRQLSQLSVQCRMWTDKMDTERTKLSGDRTLSQALEPCPPVNFVCHGMNNSSSRGENREEVGHAS